MDYENQIMELIIHGGDARGKALEAVNAALREDFEGAKELMQECSKSLNQAHEMQTSLIQAELNGADHVRVTLLMVHAQDHLMNAITVKDLALQMIEMSEKLAGKTKY